MPVHMSRFYEQKLALQRRKQQAYQRKLARQMMSKRILRFLILLVVFLGVFFFYDKELSEKFHLDQIKFDFKMPDIKSPDWKFEWPDWKIEWPDWNIKWPSFSGNKKKDGKQEEDFQSDLIGKTVSYVPMDDRPIHTTRMEYLAESFGMELKMPDAKYYRTYVGEGENSYPSYSTKYGNPIKITKWLEDQEDAGCDYYILSVDQLYSGGLIPSNYVTDDDIDVYGKNESSKILKLLMADKNNHIYLIDSIAGLAVEPGFMDFTLDDYNLLLAYSNQPRKELTGKELTLDGVLSSYANNPEGSSIATSLSIEKLNKYLEARERKMKHSESLIKMIEKSGNSHVHIMFGIQDSGFTPTSIQLNDVNYIKKLSDSKNMDIPIRDGVSSLSEEAFASMVMDSITKKIQVKVTYYGDPNQMIAGSNNSYAMEMDSLFKNLGIKQVEEKPDFEILVYTNNVPELRYANSKDLINHYLTNLKNHMPTIIMNDANYYEDQFIFNYLMDYETYRVPMGTLLGYSNWGGFIHSSRIAFSEGFVRYVYIMGGGDDDDCSKGHLRALTYSFMNDMVYEPSVKDTLDETVIESRMIENTKKIVSNLQSGNHITSIKPYDEESIRTVGSYNYHFPWRRGNELDFEISVTLGDPRPITLPEVVY